MSDIEFINGLTFKAPNENAPEYVKAKGSIKRLDLIAWLQAKEGDWVNFDLKVSKAGNWFAAVDNWKPGTRGNAPAPRQERAPAQDEFPDDSVPF